MLDTLDYLKKNGYKETRISGGKYLYTKNDDVFEFIGLGQGMLYQIVCQNGICIRTRIK